MLHRYNRDCGSRSPDSESRRAMMLCGEELLAHTTLTRGRKRERERERERERDRQTERGNIGLLLISRWKLVYFNPPMGTSLYRRREGFPPPLGPNMGLKIIRKRGRKNLPAG